VEILTAILDTPGKTGFERDQTIGLGAERAAPVATGATIAADTIGQSFL
jgi:hypothetical protein